MPNVSSSIDSLLSQANPSAIRFLRFNADNTASLLADSVMRTALGLGPLATLSDGSTITALNASNLASGTVSIARLVNTQTVGNADATIAATTRDVILNVALTLSRTFTWPLANAYPAGARVSFTDMANTLTAVNTATLARAGTDLINGATTMVLNTSGASPILISDGISRWNVDIRGVSRGGTGSTNGSITGITALTLAAGGTNQNVNLTPSGTGAVNAAGDVLIPHTKWLQLRSDMGLGTHGIRAWGSRTEFSTNGSTKGLLTASAEWVTHSAGAFAFASTTDPTTTLDLFLLRGAANTLYQRNGTAAQNFLLANTYTNDSNYERATFGFASNVLRIGTENLGTGVARAIEFVTGGTARMMISAIGDITPITDLSGNLGTNSLRFATVRANTAIFNTISNFTPGGGLLMTDGSGNNFTRLQFGGTTNLFPAIKRTGADIEIVKADGTVLDTGIILGSPLGTRYRITVSNAGVVTATAV